MISRGRKSDHGSTIQIELLSKCIVFFLSCKEIKYHTWIIFHKYHTQSTYETDKARLVAQAKIRGNVISDRCIFLP